MGYKLSGILHSDLFLIWNACPVSCRRRGFADDRFLHFKVGRGILTLGVG